MSFKDRMLNFEFDSVMLLFNKTNFLNGCCLIKQLSPLVLLILFSVGFTSYFAAPSSIASVGLTNSAMTLNSSQNGTAQWQALPIKTAHCEIIAELEEQNEQNEDDVTTHFGAFVFLYNYLFKTCQLLTPTFFSVNEKAITPSISLYLLNGVIRLWL